MYTDTNDSCYIILHRDRSSNRDRTRNLWAVIQHIKLLSNIPILVIEQDSVCDHILCKQLLDNNINYIFLYNPGLFNRSWGYNCAVNLTRYSKLILADNDLILDQESLNKGLILLKDYDIVKPFQKVYDLNLIDTINYLTGDNFNPTLSQSRFSLMAGGLLMIKRDAFITVGGYDERFEGWGGEDDEMSNQLLKYINNKTLTYYNFDSETLHLYHDRSVYDSKSQPNYKANYSYIQNNNRNNNIIIGKIDKYLYKLSKQIIAKFNARHPQWSSIISLYDDYTFIGGGLKPNGKWRIESDKYLILQWDHWPEEKLTKSLNGYINKGLKLTFLNEINYG